MADMMNFPKRWEDFLHDYEFEDARRIYTNGSRLIPSFRVKQMMEHYAPVRYGRWIDKGGYAVCMECGGRSGTQYDGVELIPLMTQFCPNCGCRMDIWDECYCAHGEKRIIEPQPDGIQFRTVDDLGRICIPKNIRDKLGVKPGTECAVYATDELTSDEIIVIRRK